MTASDNLPVSKATLCEKYGISNKTLWHLLNTKFVAELELVGYQKHMKLLPPIVVRKFIELYGEPLYGKDI